MNKFNYHQPSTLENAIALLVQHGDQARITAGGTALFVDMQHDEVRPRHVIGIEKLAALTKIYENGALHIGAGATLTDIAQFASGRADLQALVESIWLFGGKQIQNVATAGGNICKASPGADMVPPLLCLDAELHLQGPEGKRVTPLDGFLTGPDQTAIQPNEILVDIVMPPIPPRTGTAFEKMMRRQSEDISIVAAAARVTFAEDNVTAEQVRIALCAVAPTPIRAHHAEALLVGTSLEPDLIKEAARASAGDASPISDVRASAEYRLILIETLVERALLKAAARAHTS